MGGPLPKCERFSGQNIDHGAMAGAAGAIQHSRRQQAHLARGRGGLSAAAGRLQRCGGRDVEVESRMANSCSAADIS